MRFPLTSLLALTVSLTLAACGEKEESNSGDQPLSPGPEGAGGSAPSASAPSNSSPTTSSAPTSTPSVPTSTPTPSAPTPTAPTPTETAAPSTPGPEGTTPEPTAPTPTTPEGSGGAGGMTGAGGSGGTPAAAGGESTGGNHSNGGAGGADPGPSGGEFTLTSTKLVDGDEIPDDYTCEGKQFGTGPMPDLTWSGAPEGTLSFALTFVDTTLIPGNTNGYHWALWDIPANVTQIAEGPTSSTAPAGSKQYSPLGAGFLGPCPSFQGTNTDEYAFVLYAMNVETLPNPPNNVQQLVALFEANSIAKVELTGWSDAAPR